LKLRFLFFSRTDFVMAPVQTLVISVAALVSLISAAPGVAEIQRAQKQAAYQRVWEQATYEDVLNATIINDRFFRENNVCAGQSCIAADAAGSSGNPIRAMPEGGGAGDQACISKYNPEFGAWVQQHGGAAKAPKGPKQDTGLSSSLLGGLNAMWQPFTDGFGGHTDKGTFDGTCEPNILIWAKGTFEPGPYGFLVGPSFTSGLPSGWSTAGVSYDPNVPGDYCLGLPGGMVAKDVINQAAKKCPTANLFVSGYSQGAMVARNGVAYADADAKTHVKGIVTFGDPFQGSKVKGWNGPIATYCNRGDYVCTGNFELAPSHISYGFDTSAGIAQRELLKMAANAGRSHKIRRRIPFFG